MSELALLWTQIFFFFFFNKHASNVLIEFSFSFKFFDIVLSHFPFSNTEVGLPCTSAVLVLVHPSFGKLYKQPQSTHN